MDTPVRTDGTWTLPSISVCPEKSRSSMQSRCRTCLIRNSSSQMAKKRVSLLDQQPVSHGVFNSVLRKRLIDFSRKFSPARGHFNCSPRPSKNSLSTRP